VGVCIRTCGFCNVWVCVCMGFVMCGYFDNCVGVLVIRVLVFTVFCIFCTVLLYCFVYVCLFLFVLSVLVLRTTVTE
jgi:hypothetical protein